MRDCLRGAKKLPIARNPEAKFMRIFALSDIHIDYSVNRDFIEQLSAFDYQADLLILAGDVSDHPSRLAWCLQTLAQRFKHVLFVPGNHDLWVTRDGSLGDSLAKFAQIRHLVREAGASMHTFHNGKVSIVPLLGWYDYSFGEPGPTLLEAWMDFRACRWPDGFAERDITEHFLAQNQLALPNRAPLVITFSHFLPRIDVMPWMIPPDKRIVYPVLGTSLLDTQVRQIAPQLHVYGHSHVNCQVQIEGITYINNAFGYPNETRIAAKALMCIAEL